MDEDEIQSWMNLIAAMKAAGMSMQDFQNTFISQSYKLSKLLEEMYNENE